MTAPARICQADIARTVKAARDAGWKTVRAKIDFNKGVIDLMLSDAAESAATSNEWDGEIDHAA